MTRKRACIIVAAVAAVLVGLILVSDLKAESEPLPPIEYEAAANSAFPPPVGEGTAESMPAAMTAMPVLTDPAKTAFGWAQAEAYYASADSNPVRAKRDAVGLFTGKMTVKGYVQDFWTYSVSVTETANDSVNVTILVFLSEDDRALLDEGDYIEAEGKIEYFSARIYNLLDAKITDIRKQENAMSDMGNLITLQSVDEPEAFEPLEDLEQLPEESSATHILEDCRISAYCPCELCCGEYALNRPVDADGNEIVYGAWGRCRDGATVAVDPEVIPYGSYVYIQNAVTGAWDEYRATDTGGGIVEYSRTTGPIVDVFYSDHAAACNHPHAAYQTVYWSSEPVDTEVLR